MSTPSRRLRRKLDLAIPALLEAGRSVTFHPRAAELYPDYLFAIHTMIRASVPLMQAAVQAAGERGPSDDLAAALAGYLGKHIREEMHHDEWLLDDLEVLAFPREEVLGRQPSQTVAAMVGSQYYWILHHHPAALLGYIAVLEGYPPSTEQIEEYAARTGHPQAAFRTLLKHAKLDPHHRDDLNDFLDVAPLTPADEALIGTSALHTVRYAAAALDEVANRFGAAVAAAP